MMRAQDVSERNLREFLDAVMEFAHAGEVGPVAFSGSDGYVYLRLVLKAPVMSGTDMEVRRGFYLRAEEIIAMAERRGFIHTGVPKVEFGGKIVGSDGDRPPHILHECELRLEGRFE